jgi:hypothetical protein
MPKFYGQNKKRIDPRYFLEETRHRDELIQLNESMEDIHALADRYPNISDERLSHVAFMVRDYMSTFFEPNASGQDEIDAFNSLEGDERAYAEELVALNREKFGEKAGSPVDLSPADDNRETEESQIQMAMDRHQRVRRREDQRRARLNRI